MHLPPPFWACIALLTLTGMLCRRWPLLSLYGAVGAFCGVVQAYLIDFPSMPEVVVADSILFALPTVVLVRACGMSDAFSASTLAIVPISFIVGRLFGPDAYAFSMIVGVGAAQGFAAVRGALAETRSPDRSLSRWAAVCIAAIGPLGLGFVHVWSEVAWTGVAAHAFACLAYLVHDEPE